MLLGRVTKKPNHAILSRVRTIVPRTRASDTLVYGFLNKRLRRTAEQRLGVHPLRQFSAGKKLRP
ncbi:hypothetical protein MES5069_200052 [Mesorhizobium escarrei]|uniref:Uncharacterized protein n=1 Tax=Mesorhizobium escarrei TaxID=666018 RepID=A0ABM9DPE7_9HYPH|nr:hypothetical protein MES5069_200052 [Mesorhizobium escarrei]